MAKLGEVCKVSPSTKNIKRQSAWLLNLDMVEQQTGRVIEYIIRFGLLTKRCSEELLIETMSILTL